MEIKRMSEEKRNKVGWLVFGIATVVIIVVGVFFLVNSFTSNPLEGEWNCKDAGYFFDIDDDGEISIETLIDGEEVEVDAYYTIDKEAKTITIEPNFKSYEKAAKETNDMLTAADIDEYLTELMTAFDYSVEKGKLTLTEREYGEQFIFTRVK